MVLILEQKHNNYDYGKLMTDCSQENKILIVQLNRPEAYEMYAMWNSSNDRFQCSFSVQQQSFRV